MNTVTHQARKQSGTDLMLNSLDVLHTLHDEITNEADKDLLRLLAMGILQAGRNGAIYTLPRNVDYLAQYGFDHWKKVRDEIDNDTQAIFNHGDRGPENYIVALTQAADEKITVDIAVLLGRVRKEGRVFGVGFASHAGSGSIWGLPMMSFKRNESQSILCAWPLCPEAPPPPDVGQNAWVTYRGVLSYLNDQLAVATTTGVYGDNVHNQVIIGGEFMIPPAWVRVDKVGAQ